MKEGEEQKETIIVLYTFDGKYPDILYLVLLILVSPSIMFTLPILYSESLKFL
jgi:hypothetical protein